MAHEVCNVNYCKFSMSLAGQNRTAQVITCEKQIYKYSKMYLKYIYFMLSILQMHLHMYVLNTNTLQLYFYYTKLVYLKSDKLTLHLMHFNYMEVVLKSN